MVKTRPLFVMASQTDTHIARLIRAVTRYPYNHVSVTLDPELTGWYSFARYAQDAPFYGGFILETPARLLGTQGDTQVRIFRVDIPEASAAELEAMLPLANRRDSGLIYNHFDAAACAIGVRVQVPKCHTCLSFADAVLGRDFRSIAELCDALAPYEIYEGPLAELLHAGPSREDAYYVPMGLVQGSCRSAALLGKLLYRTLCHGFDSYMAHRFHRTAL